ncbi:MAG: hypothetical protein KGJ57_05015 [Sphingomonadales bacterium]|nr:hypothetical protein [Sphingomonadales bacterium]MDE2168777.1 hypothetical protein [Sphingomonadales bacterium]
MNRDLNTLPVAPHARRPRGAVRLNGVLVPGWESWEVDNNVYRAADTFSVSFAVGALPAAYGANWFSQQTGIQCEIFANEDPADPDNYSPAESERLILGQVDDINFSPVAGTITITGRDLTAWFIDTKTNEGYLNKTASQIATLLASRKGLTPVVTATTTLAGTYYNQNHISLTQERSEWDILCELARFEDFDVFVTGKELHFQPKPADTGERYAIVWTPPSDAFGSPDANVINFDHDRSLTIAKGVVVKVTSWNSGRKRKFTAVWPRGASTTKPGQSGASSPIVYPKNYPGLTQDGCLQRAQMIYRQITQHMMKLSADLPADNLLTCSNIVQVRGTGTAWDQDYYPDSVKRSMSVGEGYRMTVTAKNISADLEDTL